MNPISALYGPMTFLFDKVITFSNVIKLFCLNENVQYVMHYTIA